MGPRTLRGVRLLAAALAGTLLLAGCDFDGAYDLPLPGSPVDADESFEVTADFADVLNVVPRSPVMVDDVTVGEVVDVERIGWHARVTLRVRDDVELPDNAVADIRQVSLLGEKYVALEAPAGEPVGRLEDGDRIELPATGRNPEVEEVLGALSYLLSGGGVAQLGTITRELNDVMDGREERLKGLLANLSDVVGTLDQQKAEIIRAMESIAGLTRTLNREKQVITDALDATGPAIGVLREQHDELVGMLGSLDELGTVGTRVIRASKEDLLASLRDLRPVLRQLNAAGDHLAPGLNLLISFPFPKEASEIVKGDYANTSIRADISLENLLPGGGLLPPVDVPDPVETVGLVLQCLASGSLTSAPCTKVLGDLDLLTQLKKKCSRPAHEEKAVCQVLNLLPDLPGLEDLGGLLGGGLDGLLDGLLGAPAARGTAPPTLADLVGGGAA
ncbi:MAG: MCE family protein [Actinobacteria bacterium]|jgi:phospholipid/cholesterol/gamma-HCH transport system substrate-binding protein|nr:MCE family protein [Actinomycetota bacterium]MBU2110058.1 MCE family protein [Actinomycetota bacterium]